MSQGLKLGGGRKGIYTSGPHSALSDRQHHLGPLTRCQFSGWSRRLQMYRIKTLGLRRSNLSSTRPSRGRCSVIRMLAQI